MYSSMKFMKWMEKMSKVFGSFNCEQVQYKTRPCRKQVKQGVARDSRNFGESGYIVAIRNTRKCFM